jgi:hypothetical protein
MIFQPLQVGPLNCEGALPRGKILLFKERAFAFILSLVDLTEVPTF